MTTSDQIHCSVIVPVYEHWHLIPTLLGYLGAQSVPQQDFEVILVDNGSSRFDPPDHLAPNIRIEQCEKPGSYAARNHGVQCARGHWLVFTDADCQPHTDWLARLVGSASEPIAPTTLRAGAVEMRAASDRPNAYEMYDLVKGIPQEWYVSRGYAATASLAIPAPLFGALGGFDESRFSGGDAEFCRRAVSKGTHLSYVPEAVVRHPTRDNWKDLAAKARRIKGAHLTTGPAHLRLRWTLRTMTPPIIALWRFMNSSHAPLKYRVTASAIQIRLWGAEIREAIRLAGSGVAERR